MQKMRVLVTGGGGFLGSHIVKRLRDSDYIPISASRHSYAHLRDWGVEQRSLDLGRAAHEWDHNLLEGIDAIIHTAAKAGIWGAEEEFERTNISGTIELLRLAKERGLRRFVYTSSPSVIFSGLNHCGADESLPYPQKFLAAYPRTKAQAEQIVLKAADKTFKTVALRPHLIWGPGDPHFLPRIVRLAQERQGRFFRLSRQSLMVDAIHVENAAYAHVLALEALDRVEELNGQSLFVSNQEPWDLYRLIKALGDTQGLDISFKYLPQGLAFAAGALAEIYYKICRKTSEPPITRFMAQQLSLNHWYRTTKAEKLLGFSPIKSMNQGLMEMRAQGPKARN